MAEYLETKLERLKAKLDELKRNLPLDNIPLSTILEIESIEREIGYLTSDTLYYDFDEDISIN